jgi:hypothetical protein
VPSGLGQLILLVSAYSPLALVYAFLGTFGDGRVAAGLVGLATLSWVGLALFIRSSRRFGVEALEIAGNRPRDSDAVGYVVTYLLPFVMGANPRLEEKIATGVFFVLIGVLYLRAHLFYVNPVLSLVGYRLFEVEIGHGTYLLISRRRALRPKGRIKAHRLSDYVFLEAIDR